MRIDPREPIRRFGPLFLGAVLASGCSDSGGLLAPEEVFPLTAAGEELAAPVDYDLLRVQVGSAKLLYSGKVTLSFKNVGITEGPAQAELLVDGESKCSPKMVSDGVGRGPGRDHFKYPLCTFFWGGRGAHAVEVRLTDGIGTHSITVPVTVR